MTDPKTSIGPGRRKAVNPEDVLEAIEEADKPFLSTGDIEDAVGVSKPTAIDRLKTLKKQGRVRSNTVAGNVAVWYLPHHKNRTLEEYSDGEATSAEPSPRADGAATGELADRVTETRHQMVQVMDHLESLEEEVAGVRELQDEEDEEPPDTWRQKAEREARVAWRAATRSAVTFVSLFVVWLGILSVPEVSLPFPVFSSVQSLVGFAVALIGLTAILFVAWWGIVSASVRFGLADRLER